MRRRGLIEADQAQHKPLNNIEEQIGLEGEVMTNGRCSVVSGFCTIPEDPMNIHKNAR
jgi:hypothetical protein